MKKIITMLVALFMATSFSACSIVEPNYEGIKMTNWGKNGIEDFVEVHGNAGIIYWLFGEKIYRVPMFETTGGLQEVKILAIDAGEFRIDPHYQYKPSRGKGKKIVFDYKHIAGNKATISLDNIEEKILNVVVYNAYREVAREYTTDDLMSNLNQYEKKVEERLVKEFKNKGFDLISLTSGLEPPKSMKNAIEARNNSIQRARQVENDLQVAKNQQDIARIEQETNRIKSIGLTDKILTEQYIDMLLRTKNKVIITDGKTPLIISR
jgi:regulator of protease activity HflC (stomatin/prohibitin superfamily)